MIKLYLKITNGVSNVHFSLELKQSHPLGAHGHKEKATPNRDAFINRLVNTQVISDITWCGECRRKPAGWIFILNFLRLYMWSRKKKLIIAKTMNYGEYLKKIRSNNVHYHMTKSTDIPYWSNSCVKFITVVTLLSRFEIS